MMMGSSCSGRGGETGGGLGLGHGLGLERSARRGAAPFPPGGNHLRAFVKISSYVCCRLKDESFVVSSRISF